MKITIGEEAKEKLLETLAADADFLTRYTVHSGVGPYHFDTDTDLGGKLYGSGSTYQLSIYKLFKKKWKLNYNGFF